MGRTLHRGVLILGVSFKRDSTVLPSVELLVYVLHVHVVCANPDCIIPREFKPKYSTYIVLDSMTLMTPVLFFLGSCFSLKTTLAGNMVTLFGSPS